jgi:hypothetical protein
LFFDYPFSVEIIVLSITLLKAKVNLEAMPPPPLDYDLVPEKLFYDYCPPILD